MPDKKKEQKDYKNTKPFYYPDCCPICGATLVFSEASYYCPFCGFSEFDSELIDLAAD